MDESRLTSMETDAIGEILNISLGSAATAISTMLSARVDITTPVVKMRNKDEFEFVNLEPAIGVEIAYQEGLSGSNVMLLRRSDVIIIVGMLMGTELTEDQFSMDEEIYTSAIGEVMNQMMGASSTALSEMLNRVVDISTPVSFNIHGVEQFKNKYFAEHYEMVEVSFDLMIGDRINSEFKNLMPVELAKEIIVGFGIDIGGMEVEPVSTPVFTPPSEPAPAPAPTPSGGGDVMSEDAIAALLASNQAESAPAPTSSGGGDVMSEDAIAALLAASQSEPAPAPTPEPVPVPQPVQVAPQVAPVPMQPAPQYYAQPSSPAVDKLADSMAQMMEMMRMQMEMTQAQMQRKRPEKSSDPKTIKVDSPPRPNLFQEFVPEALDSNLELVMKVPVEVSVEIGRTKKLVKDILELNKGSVVVLDKLAGEQVDLFVNGQCIAQGDVVVVDDSFAIRITEILSREVLEEKMSW